MPTHPLIPATSLAAVLVAATTVIAVPASALAQDGAKPPSAAAAGDSPAVFHMKDGAVLIGPVDVTTLKVKTAYGVLDVPVREIYSVRFGRRCDPKLVGKVGELIAKLGDGDFTVRNQATEALIEIGISARPELEAALESSDLEVKTRARKILTEVTKQAVEGADDPDGEALEQDEIVTAQFPIKGCLQAESFKVRTKYGPLLVEKGDIARVQFHEPPRTEETVDVPGTATAQGAWKGTGIQVKKGQRIRVLASGNITIPNYGITTGPDGQAGNSFMANLPIGCLVGKVGDGEMFQLGEKGDQRATAAGELKLAVAAPNSGNGGSYKVKVIVENDKD